MIEKLYPVPESAAVLNVSKPTIRSWYYQGLLKGVKLGRRLMFAESELQRFIERGMQHGKVK